MSFRINTVNDAALDEYTHKRGDLLKQTSRSYSPEEMATIYQLYNSYNPHAKKNDTGCGSCRRQVLNYMTAKWHELDKKQPKTNV